MRKILIVAGTVVSVALSACASSSHARKVTPTDFLGDNAKLLKKGGKSDFLLVYRNPNAPLVSYDKVILEPVKLWAPKGADAKLPPDQQADLQRLVDSFDHTLREKLAKDYKMVDAPAPGAMRIEVAIVSGKKANSTLKVAKTVAPYAGTADTVWSFVTGKPAFAGEASLEFMIHDTKSGELLVAGADRRVGGNQLGKATVKDWGDVENILTYWSDEAVYALCVDRKAQNCVKPSAGILESPIQ
jgi:uncharacterized protein DUF3313